MDLRARLDRLREEARRRHECEARDADAEAVAHAGAEPLPTARGGATLRGTEADTPLGPVFYRDTWHPLDHRHGALPLRRLLGVPGSALAQLARDPRLEGVTCERLAFIDTETTGLAGGTGTVAFLIGVGLYRDGSFLVRQYFLRDYSEEPAALVHLSELLSGRAEAVRARSPLAQARAAAGAVVSFNGKSFDLPLIETRYLMQRGRSPLRGLPHLDLLHPARRIFKERLGDCSLSSLEAAVLGHQRAGDVPGHLIPALYFDYLQTRRLEPIEVIIEHNRQDLLALVGLGAELGRAISDPIAWDAPGPDFVGLGRLCEDLRRFDEAAACYEMALARGAGDLARRRALRCLARLRKRRHEHAAAAAAWSELEAIAPSVEALVELAKHHEHRTRDYQAAIEATRRALDLAAQRRSWGIAPAAPGPIDRPASHRSGPASDGAALRRRLARLERKQARARGGPAADLLNLSG